MSKEEKILFRLKELIEEKLPDIIREENQGHNDGTIVSKIIKLYSNACNSKENQQMTPIVKKQTFKHSYT